MVEGDAGHERRLHELQQDAHTTIPVVTRDEYEASRAWGLYTSIDAFECSAEKISEREQIERYTIELCRILDVNRYGEPQMVLFGHEPSIFGWSMSQMIETSLVSGHFIQQPRTAYIDIFSCKYYDATQAIRFTVEFFEAASVTYHSVLRNRAGRHPARLFVERS